MNYYIIPGLKYKQSVKIDLDFILHTVAEFFEIDVKDITSKKRDLDFVKARSFFYQYARKECINSLKAVGEKVGKRDHTTVIHGLKTFSDRCETEPSYQRDWIKFLSFLEDKKSIAA